MTQFSDDRFDASLDEARETLTDLTDLSDRFARSFTTSMASAIRSGRSFSDTLRSLGSRLSEIALKAGMKPLENLLAKGLEGIVSAVTGSATPFAKGGVVASPTYFTAGGKSGLMGEAGPEAIMPLARGPDGRLGIAGGQSGGAVSITVNIATPDVASFRKSQAQVSAQLARAVSRARRTL